MATTHLDLPPPPVNFQALPPPILDDLPPPPDGSLDSEKELRESQAALTIQTTWRAHHHKREYRRTREAVRITQSSVRGWLARKQYKVLYSQNRWRLEAPKPSSDRLVSPARDKAAFRGKRKPPTRGHKVASMEQSVPDPAPSGIIDEPEPGSEESGDDKPKPNVRKSMMPGMMGGIAFDPAMVKLKSAPRLSLNLPSPTGSDSQDQPAPAFELKRLKSNPRPASESMVPVDPKQVSPLKPVLRPTSSNAQSNSMPDMPTMPRLKSAKAPSPLSTSPSSSRLQVNTTNDLPPPPANLPPPIITPVDLPPPIITAPTDLPPPPPLDSGAATNSLPPPLLSVATPAKAPSPQVPKKPGPKMVLPPEWEMHVDIQGRKYYHNTETELTQWRPPPLVPEASAKKAPPKMPQQQPSQVNLLSHLEMLIPTHKFAPQVPKKPPPPPTGSPPPSPAPAPVHSHTPAPAAPEVLPPPPSSLPPPIVAHELPPPPITSQPLQPPGASSSSTQPSTHSQRTLERQSSDTAAKEAKEAKEKRSALRRLLDAFLGKRPTKAELIRKNILPEEEGARKLDDKERKKLEKEKKKREKEDKRKSKMVK